MTVAVALIVQKLQCLRGKAAQTTNMRKLWLLSTSSVLPSTSATRELGSIYSPITTRGTYTNRITSQ